ncbi:MAG: hypothetical protein AB7J28_05195 [Hyphomonadaceae bacterium]
MKARFITAAAAAFALTQAVAVPAYATEGFRTAAPQTFTAQELQQYGLDAQATQRAVQLQQDGYQVMALSPEEAEQYTAGITDNQWILLGILAGVIIIAVAVAD